MGDISQLDYYNNSKLQYFFNTANALYLLDRRGKSVGNFPVQLTSSATNASSVVDYEKNRNYRFFVASKDKSIRVFDKNGKRIALWKLQFDGELTQPIKYIRIGTKDYLVFGDKHELHILNRKGENVLKSKINIPLSQNRIEISSQSETPQLVCTDKDGTVHFINFKGEREFKQFKHFSQGHYFDFEDIKADGRKEFIFLDKNELEAYSSDGTKVFSYTFNSEINKPIITTDFSFTDHKIGVVSTADSKIYLFDLNGKLQNGFPLEGNTEFTISNMKDANMYNLIVGGKENFLYNYLVQYSRP